MEVWKDADVVIGAAPYLAREIDMLAAGLDVRRRVKFRNNWRARQQAAAKRVAGWRKANKAARKARRMTRACA